MKEFKLHYKEGFTELDYLEQIYAKVKLKEKVKFNGKAYTRITPKNNKYYKYPYHFELTVKNIYDGNMTIVDKDGEEVTLICDYKLVIEQ